MISVVNMIINYTCVRLNGLNQHKRTSALNWRTNGIIRGNIISLGYYRGLNSGGLWESGIVLPLPEVMSGINYSSVIKDLKIYHRGILTWIQTLGGVCVHVCACFDVIHVNVLEGGFCANKIDLCVSRVLSPKYSSVGKSKAKFICFIDLLLIVSCHTGSTGQTYWL